MEWYEQPVEEEAAHCHECGETFFRRVDQRWKRVCLGCYIKRKREEEGATRGKAEQKWQRKQQEQQQERKRQEQEQQRRYREQNRERQSSAGGAGGLSEEMLRRLLQLCHPDKHGGSQAALRATQWLLEQRKR